MVSYLQSNSELKKILYLLGLFFTPIKPLKEFHLFIIGSTSIKIGWKKPTDIISYYIINYYPLNMGNDSFTETLKVDIGKYNSKENATTIFKFFKMKI